MERHSFSIVSGESPQDVLRNLKKLLLEILQNSQKKHLYWRLVVNEVAGWRLGTLFKRDSESRTLSCLFRKVFKKTFIGKVCGRLFLDVKIFARVSFRKVSGFYYKQNIQLF